MSAKNQLKLEVIVKILAGDMERSVARQILDVSQRTLERYLADYRVRGARFVEHRNTGKEPANKTSFEIKLQTQTLIQKKYFDFNMTHALEKMASEPCLTQVPKAETFRKWCHEIHHVKRAKNRRTPKARYARQRMRQRGLMIQLDGSPHRWFGNVPSCLIAGIDDADSEVPFGEFFHSEDSLSCMRVLQKIVEKCGLFQILYVDRAGIFGGAKRANFSQVKRALNELGIHIIFAYSPEAKGRIERLWNTLQDRLIPEMRLRNIKTFPAANSFLQDQFLPNQYRQLCTRAPADPQSAYRALPAGIDLKEILCLKEYRMVKRDHTFGWNGEIYRILKSPVTYSIYKQNVEIRTYQDLSWKVFYAGSPISVENWKSPHLPAKQPEPLEQISSQAA